MTCNRFNFIHASIVFAKKLNTQSPVKKDHDSMKSCLLGWLMNDHTCTMCRYSAKQKFFGTKNTKQIPLFTTKVSCTQKERFFEILCKIGSLGCLTKCSKGHLRIANGTYSLISQNILLSIIRYFTKFFFE